jgi:hypothetical protein
LNRKTIGIVLIYTAAVCILLSILFLFNLIPFRLPYTMAAFGFLLYVVGIFLSREGKFSAYKIAMIVLSLLLIFLAVTREIIRL